MSSREMNRRAVLVGTAAIVPAAAVGAIPALSEPSELVRLIEANKAAGLAFHEACTEEEADLDEPSAAWEAANKAEESTLMALCAYRCRTLDEARIKAEHLLSTSTVKDDLPQEWFIGMLLRSFLAEGDLQAMGAAS